MTTLELRTSAQIVADELEPAPLFTQRGAASDVLPVPITIRPQWPFATATGASRVPGSLFVDIGAPTNAGTTEGFLSVQRGGTTRLQLGYIAAAPVTGDAASLLRADTDQDLAISTVAGTGRVIIASGAGGGQPIFLRGNVLSIYDPSARGLDITPAVTTTIEPTATTATVALGAAATVRTWNLFTGNAVQTVNIATHATPVHVINIGGTASTLGFFGATAVVKQADIGALTDSTGQTPDNTIENVPDPADTPASADALRDDLVANTLPAIERNLSDLTDQLNGLRTVLRNYGLM